MHKPWIYILFFFFVFTLSAQITEKDTEKPKDSLESSVLLKQIGNGFFPTKIWNFDLRYFRLLFHL